MKKLKDVFYDKNDILVALIIVILAAAVIITNIGSILNYPSTIAAEIQVPEKETPTTYAENPPITDPSGDDAANSQGSTAAAIDGQNTSGGGVTENGEIVNYSVYIAWGDTNDKIADLLIGVGLFQNRQQFYDAVAASGAEGKLQAGNFIIPSDSTPAEVISILTQ